MKPLRSGPNLTLQPCHVPLLLTLHQPHQDFFLFFTPAKSDLPQEHCTCYLLCLECTSGFFPWPASMCPWDLRSSITSSEKVSLNILSPSQFFSFTSLGYITSLPLQKLLYSKITSCIGLFVHYLLPLESNLYEGKNLIHFTRLCILNA